MLRCVHLGGVYNGEVYTLGRCVCLGGVYTGDVTVGWSLVAGHFWQLAGHFSQLAGILLVTSHW